MAKELEPKVIVGLEVGTSKVVAVVGEVLPDGVVNVLGVGSCPSKGIDRGSITDLDAAVSYTHLAIIWLYWLGHDTDATRLVIPFFKDIMPQLGLFYIVLSYFVIVGTGNAVNLTDGLDGLAIMPTALVAGAFALIAWATGNVNFAEYLHIPYIKYSSEVVVFCTAIVGAGLGFLWFNTYPAQVFMGDVGSLALGGALGVVAILVRQEFLLVIMGGVFVVEALSVILQVGSYKLRKQRIFRMAPIHHHFELKGWPEPRVIIRFWIISLMLVLMGLVTLKLR